MSQPLIDPLRNLSAPPLEHPSSPLRGPRPNQRIRIPTPNKHPRPPKIDSLKLILPTSPRLHNIRKQSWNRARENKRPPVFGRILQEEPRSQTSPLTEPADHDLIPRYAIVFQCADFAFYALDSAGEEGLVLGLSGRVDVRVPRPVLGGGRDDAEAGFCAGGQEGGY